MFLGFLYEVQLPCTSSNKPIGPCVVMYLPVYMYKCVYMYTLMYVSYASQLLCVISSIIERFVMDCCIQVEGTVINAKMELVVEMESVVSLFGLIST